MPLKTIEEHNQAIVDAAIKAEFTGISCPGCGTELLYSGVLLLSSPPQRSVYCPKCYFSGSVYT